MPDSITGDLQQMQLNAASPDGTDSDSAMQDIIEQLIQIQANPGPAPAVQTSSADTSSLVTMKSFMSSPSAGKVVGGRVLDSSRWLASHSHMMYSNCSSSALSNLRARTRTIDVSLEYAPKDLFLAKLYSEDGVQLSLGSQRRQQQACVYQGYLHYSSEQP